MPSASQPQYPREPEPHDVPVSPTETSAGHTPGSPGPTGRAKVGHTSAAAARGTGRAAKASAKATGRAAKGAVRVARRASHAEGAGESGLSRLIEMHAFGAAGDAAVAISLAGTLFFPQPGAEDQARSQVALFLLLTMLPFAVVAPLIGPFLDRFSHGRRWAMGATMAVRAFLCWLLAGAIAAESLAMFPAALGVLVASKAYGVTRAAAVPRLAPASLGLVKANSRISAAGIVGAMISAPLALLASQFGAEWSLRYAFAVFVGATILAILLPTKVDNTVGEVPSDVTGATLAGMSHNRGRRARVPHNVVLGLRANSGLRMLTGFLTLFMAFLLRDQPFQGWEGRPELLIGLVIGAAGFGNAIGIALGNILRRVDPRFSVLLAIFSATGMAVFAAVTYTLLTAVLLGLTAGLAQSFGKLSLDSMIQTEIPESQRSSAFARSETLLQLSWVAGAFLGIALPLIPRPGLGAISMVLIGMSIWVLRGLRDTTPATSPEPEAELHPAASEAPVPDAATRSALDQPTSNDPAGEGRS